MKQILVTVDTNQPLQNIRKAINMLRGLKDSLNVWLKNIIH